MGRRRVTRYFVLDAHLFLLVQPDLTMAGYAVSFWFLAFLFTHLSSYSWRKCRIWSADTSDLNSTRFDTKFQTVSFCYAFTFTLTSRCATRLKFVITSSSFANFTSCMTFSVSVSHLFIITVTR